MDHVVQHMTSKSVFHESLALLHLHIRARFPFSRQKCKNDMLIWRCQRRLLRLCATHLLRHGVQDGLDGPGVEHGHGGPPVMPRVDGNLWEISSFLEVVWIQAAASACGARKGLRTAKEVEFHRPIRDRRSTDSISHA